MAGTLFSRMLLALKAGLQFGNIRDVYNVFGYNRTPKPEDYVARYVRQDITARIVNEPPESTWTKPPTLGVDESFRAVWNMLVDKHQLWPVFTQADKLLNFGEFSCILLGVPGELKSPITKLNLEKLAYISAFGEPSIKIKQYVTKETDPRFGLPEIYELEIGEDSSATRRYEVHWSRIVHFTDKPLQGKIRSNPRMSSIYNLLDDLLKVVGGGAETFWITANRGMQVDIEKDMELDPADALALEDELEEYQHQLRRFVRTRGVKMTPLGSDTPSPKDNFITIISLISAATGIPQRILLGAEAGQLASEQDRANWSNFLARRRVSFAQPYMLIPFIRHLQLLGALPPNVEPITFDWPESFDLNPLERAQTMAQAARAIVNLSRQAQYGHPLVTLQEAREILQLPAELPEGQELPPSFSIPEELKGPEEVDPAEAATEAAADAEDEGMADKSAAGNLPSGTGSE